MKAMLSAAVTLFLLGSMIGCGGEQAAETETEGMQPLAEMTPEMQSDSLMAQLTGGTAVPGPGDPDGSGMAMVVLNPAEMSVCYELTYENIGEPSAAHIHSGAAGASGPPVVTLELGSDCVDADSSTIAQIQQAPANYYVNVHTPEFGAGAVRGQLESSEQGM